MKKVNEGTRCTHTVHDNGVALMEINNPPMNALSAGYGFGMLRLEEEQHNER